MARKNIFLAVLLSGLLALPARAGAASALVAAVPIDQGAAAALKNRSLTLTFGAASWKVPAAVVAQWYKVTSSGGHTTLQLQPGAIYDYLNRYISPKINDLGEQSRFVRVNGALQLAGAGRKGRIVDGIKTSLAIRAALVGGKSVAGVAMKEYRPAIFSAEDFKKLSFPDKLAQGESSFAGSPANRIHNIRVATARYNGLVVMPGEEFSFNHYLGEVTAENGYLPELVIKENTTTPEFGGGICQVSTTAFRAAMQAGLLITARHNHSYPVAYYGTPGYDATVYNPSPDLRFKNDTGSPMYILTSINGPRVIFEVWGKSDGRVTKINGPYITDKKPDGSVTAAVAQLISRGGKSIREQNFVSHYQSPDKFPTVRKANGE